jgi:glycosyltransferase involved in cell wall biosynthesis
VEKAIDTVMTQTYRPIELLVVDDGSSDKTLEAIQEAHQRWRGAFFYETQANRGVNSTLNDLIRRSTGKYVCLFSSDDWMLPDKTKIQVEYLEKHPEVGMVYSGSLRFNRKTNRLGPNILKEKAPPSGWIFAKLLQEDFIVAVSNLIRKSCLEEAGFLDEHSVVSDWDQWLRIASRYQIHYIDKPLVVYRVHGNNAINYMPLKMLRHKRQLLEKYCDDPILLEKLLRVMALEELCYYSIRDKKAAGERFRALKKYCYKRLYMKSVVKFLLFLFITRLNRDSKLKKRFLKRFFLEERES